ncbi:pre-peptidase C-terminal domain-containing protein [Rhodanobacter sp. FDAARGOS 1247]|uniref:PA domain-containing protein n=1 Tax=Rhodanobacter sp. FDAARGOS 1247 TaxID=2778082 RepID=UPI001951BAE6|nr:PA domain-containing protein [Rhodanobacter sp. FDAARGOS 1247]QRP63717.1 pre-peptidase C-terminal domain-containing protein [Rhodanobacter sp. FDAARGOS 1247]
MIRRNRMFNAFLGLGLIFMAGQVSAADIKISNQDVGTGQGLDDPTPATPVGGNPGTTRGEQAQIVFKFAADIWGAVLQSDVPVTVSASFAKLSCDATSGVLGSAGTTNIYSFAAPAPQGAVANTWYHSALFDSLAGEDAGDGAADIRARFNGALGSTGCLEGSSWYFGLDGKQPAGSIDFLNVVLHEMAHGLGFSGFGSLTTGQPLQGNDGVGRQDIYTTFVYDDTQQKSWYAMTPTQRVASALNDGNLVFTGANVKEQAPLALGKVTTLRVSAPAGAAGDYAFNQSSSPIPATPANFSGSIIGAISPPLSPSTSNLEGCNPFTNAADVAGHLVLVNRGTCSFDIKAGNAIAAGATGVIIANNAAGTIVPAITASIPVISVSQADGNTLRANLAGLTGALVLGDVMAGADAAGNVQLYAPTVLAQGSSFSHYDTRLTPNALMEYAINSDLAGHIDLDLTPALFQDEGWQLNEGTQSLLDCDSGIPTWLPGGVVIGANVVANARIIAGAAPTVGDYRPVVRAYAAGLATDGLITGDQASSLNACLSDAETLNQWKAWSAFAPQEISAGVTVPGQSGAAASSKVYTLEVPAGALGLSLRTLGGTGDVTVYVKLGSQASPADYDWKSVHARTNSEAVMITRPVAGTYYLTVYGETDYSGVTVLGNFTQR